MTADFILTVLKTFGLPVMLLLVLGWAYWRKDQELKELNDELRGYVGEMTAALVGHKEATAGMKEVLVAVDSRLNSVEEKVTECKSAVQNCRRTP